MREIIFYSFAFSQVIILVTKTKFPLYLIEEIRYLNIKMSFMDLNERNNKKMKLILTNFRKHEDKTFEFSDKPGLTLISGISGCGKSTIFKAIAFAIAGGKRGRGLVGKTLITRGKRKCSVELEYKGIHINSIKPKGYNL